MFKFRVISFPVLLAIFGVMVLNRQFGPTLFAAAATLMMGAVAKEFLAILERKGYKNLPYLGMLSAMVIAAGACFYYMNDLLLVHFGDKKMLEYIVGGVVVGIPGLLLSGMSLEKLKSDQTGGLTGRCGGWNKFPLKVIITWAGVALTFVIYGSLIFLYVYDTGFGNSICGNTSGMTTLFYLVIVTKMMDTGGYIAGKLTNEYMKNGNHKLLPAISPNKSWEGTIGGLVFSIGASYAFYKFGAINIGAKEAVALGAVLGVGSLFGDLLESALKRWSGIKDSGTVIPGMGGVFDVLDSFILNGGLFALYLYKGFKVTDYINL